ncbi:tagaturonate reductase [Necropsobacter massiliensis]|uniref:tagaturonate reductase n=1 Tax=Necropsobacter massiliensis TaxID=1400001 RepID=UPI00059611F9|nr:tagaturonate reductase [Necropsobacter massiliensis]
MIPLNRTHFPGKQYPTKIIQFGEGNFLRAFIDWQIDVLNEQTDLNAGVVIVRPINTDFPPLLNMQDGLYTTIIRGLNENGEVVKQSRIIRSVNNEINIYQHYDDYLALAHNPEIKFIFSNTTEAGISYHEGDRFDDRPPVSYPAKLTRLLFERFTAAGGDVHQGFVLLPCELIDYNGEQLKALVLKYAREWQLSDEFMQWLETANTFCSTLVDRIVTGYPRNEVAELEAELGYQDSFLDTAEYFYLFVIQGPQSLTQMLRLDQANLNVLIVDDIKPYKERKVAILNGAHTALVPVAYLAGVDTVGAAMNDPALRRFVQSAVENEIIPVLSLPQDELRQFAEAVIKRFQNPFIQHQLLSIALNSMTKYRTRNLPQLLAYVRKYQKLPPHLTFALAALIAFYRGERNGQPIVLQDDAIWLTRYKQWWRQFADGDLTLYQLVQHVLQQKDHWQQDLTQVPQLVERVAEQLNMILEKGMRAALAHYCGD